jgi:hypothetical protein
MTRGEQGRLGRHADRADTCRGCRTFDVLSRQNQEGI